MLKKGTKVKHKIAVIATELLEAFLEDVFRAMEDRFEYRIFVYHRFQDIRAIHAELSGEYEGILTSGSFPAHMIRLYFPEETRPIGYFNTDASAMYRLFLQLLEKRRDLDFNRVYADILEVFGVRTIDFVEGRASMPDISVLSDEEFSLERMEALEKEQYETHLRLWKEGKTDLSISRYSSIVPALQAEGVEIYFPYPSVRYVEEVCDALLLEIERRQLLNRQPGIAILRIGPERPGKEAEPKLDYAYFNLENAVIEYLGGNVINYSIQRQYYGLEIVTLREEIWAFTDGFQEDLLRLFLRERLKTDEICTGYGIGKSIAQARMNALDACAEAYAKGKSGYLITENGDLIGPLGDAKKLLIIPSKPERQEMNSALSPITVQKIRTAFEAAGGELAARELALRLGITKRSANRFLAVLSKEGNAVGVRKSKTTTKGRPEMIYRLQ